MTSTQLVADRPGAGTPRAGSGAGGLATGSARAGRATTTPTRLEEAGQLLRALAAPIRLAVIVHLADGPHCVRELVESLGASQSLVSQHLRILRAARLVTSTRRCREIVYALSDNRVAHIVRDAITQTSGR
jgi:ArsR family transcriptional regulator, zinc-responsive transcriptional repressor